MDTSWSALLRPQDLPRFQRVKAVERFDGSAADFSLANAWWLANASHLAYADSGAIAGELKECGLELLEFFSGESTQAYVALGDGFALLVFRGTDASDWSDVATDADIMLRRLRKIRKGSGGEAPEPIGGGAKAHRGFVTALDEVWTNVAQRLEALSAQGLSLWYAGHSLGGALAALAAVRHRPKAVYTFGSPLVGDRGFATILEADAVHRVENGCDIVTMVPPEALGYVPVGDRYFISHRNRLFVNPGEKALRRMRFRGWLRYVASVPWLRGRVPSRLLADHSIVNYTAAIERLYVT